MSKPTKLQLERVARRLAGHLVGSGDAHRVAYLIYLYETPHEWDDPAICATVVTMLREALQRRDQSERAHGGEPLQDRVLAELDRIRAEKAAA